MEKTYLFRADGDSATGMGHLMRCLTIASAIKGRVVFVCGRKESAEVVCDRGFETIVLDSDPFCMEEEIPKWNDFCLQWKKPVMILVDSYYVTDTYLTALQKYGTVALLDDCCEHCHPAHMIINYNVFADLEQYKRLYRDTKTLLYVGGSFVPVRQEFQNSTYQIRETAGDILITTGGGDIDNIGGEILTNLVMRMPTMQFHLVAGRFHPGKEELKEFAAQRENVHIYEDVTDMAALMKKCDICVSAGGTTVYELSSIGVPLVVFSYAKNQEALPEYLGRKQIAAYGGAWHKDKQSTLNRICNLVEDLASSYEKRWEYWKQERLLIDGKGAERIAALLFRGADIRKEHEE